MRAVERRARRLRSSIERLRPSCAAVATMVFFSCSIWLRIDCGRESARRKVMKYVAESASQCGRRPRSRIVMSRKRGRDAGATARDFEVFVHFRSVTYFCVALFLCVDHVLELL